MLRTKAVRPDLSDLSLKNVFVHNLARNSTRDPLFLTKHSWEPSLRDIAGVCGCGVVHVTSRVNRLTLQGHMTHLFGCRPFLRFSATDDENAVYMAVISVHSQGWTHSYDTIQDAVEENSQNDPNYNRDIDRQSEVLITPP